MSQKVLIDATESESSITIALKKPSKRYFDELVGLTCGPDLLSLGLFPNAKEITESFAAYRAAMKLGLPLSDPRLEVVVVGDGSTPRTAATFAFRSKWICTSVDPALGKWPKDWEGKVQRLKVAASKIEDWQPARPLGPTLVVAVHSHANLQVALDRVSLLAESITGVIAIPCCVPQTLDGQDPDWEYADWGIWSPQRTVRIWRSR